MEPLPPLMQRAMRQQFDDIAGKPPQRIEMQTLRRVTAKLQGKPARIDVRPGQFLLIDIGGGKEEPYLLDPGTWEIDAESVRGVDGDLHMRLMQVYLDGERYDRWCIKQAAVLNYYGGRGGDA